MDTEAQPTERDRSLPPDPEDPSGAPGPEGRSRSALVSRLTDRLPGGRITLTLLLCLLFLLAVNTFVARPFEIPSGSMEKGLTVGDRVLVNKLAYRFGDGPDRGDVIVFDGAGYFGDADYIKRVVGVGGDHVVCCDAEGRIRVNGRSVDESGFLFPGDSPSTVRFDVVVPEGRLFVLGDHRSNSSDSRDRLGSPGGGMVPVEDVIGRAEGVVWPFGRAGLLEPTDAYAGVPAGEASARPGAAGGAGAAGGSGRASGPGAAGGSGRASGPGAAGGSGRASGPGAAGGSGRASGPGVAGGSGRASEAGVAGDSAGVRETAEASAGVREADAAAPAGGGHG